VGEGWVLCGDSFGFVDPVFSSGLLMAFDSSKELAKAIIAGGSARHLAAYEKHVRHHLCGWHRAIEHWYDGRLFTLIRMGEDSAKSRGGKLMGFHLRKHLPRVFSGEASTSRYSVGLVDFMCKHALRDNDPADCAIL
jgi:flavin-dependent dehydrogenase